jgi:uncharacterized protein YbaP (TraB family)
MRRLSLFFLLILLVPATQARGLAKVETPALIQLDTEPPSWIFGTIHLPDPRVTTLHPDAQRAFDAADVLYTELPMDSASTMRVALKGLRDDGKTLFDVLPERTWNRLDKRLKRIDSRLSAFIVMPMKTWAVYGGMMLFESQMQYPTLKALDWQLYSQAEKAGKTVGGLESMEEQLRAFEQFTEQEQQQMLETVLDQMDDFDRKGISVTEFMIQWYLSGDYALFEQLMQEIPLAQDAALRKTMEKSLIYDRNARFAKRIIAKLRENPGKSVFFAIGMGHLGGGERSVQGFLEKAGIGTKTPK